MVVAARASQAAPMELLPGRTCGRVAMTIVITTIIAAAYDTVGTNDTACTAYTDGGTGGTGHSGSVYVCAMVDEELDDVYATARRCCV